MAGTCFQVFTVDNTHADPVKQERGCWRRGMVVDVYDNDAVPEPPSPGSKSVFIRVPNLDVAAARKYIRRRRQGDRDDGKVVGRRRFVIRLDELPARLRRELRENKEITLKKGPLLKLLLDKATQRREG